MAVRIMSKKQAVSIAVKAMQKAKKEFAIEANIARLLGGPQNNHQESSLKQYNRLNEAIKIILSLVLLVLSGLACSVSDMTVPAASTETAIGSREVDLATPQTAMPAGSVDEDGVYWPGDVPAAGDVLCVTAETALNLRAWAGEDGPIRTTLSNGDVVRLVGPPLVVDGADWQQIELLPPLDGGGWVNAQYLGGCG